MHRGFIKLHRAILDHWVFKDRDMLALWIYCLAKAAWEDYLLPLSRTGGTIPIKRGEFLTSKDKLHEGCFPEVTRKGKKTEKHHSSQTTWRMLGVLEKHEMLTRRLYKGCTIVSVCNYGAYQDSTQEVVREVGNSLEQGCPKVGTGLYPVEEGKELKEDTTTIASQSSGSNGDGKKRRFKYPDSFTRWWESYPKERRKGKKKTFDAWKTAGGRLKDEHEWDSQSACDFLQGKVEEYAASPAGKRVQYVKDAHRWLEHGQYDDDPAAWQQLDDGNGQAPQKPLVFRD